MVDWVVIRLAGVGALATGRTGCPVGIGTADWVGVAGRFGSARWSAGAGVGLLGDLRLMLRQSVLVSQISTLKLRD